MFKVLHKPTLLLLFLSALMVTSCLEEDPCPGEPWVITYNELVTLKFRTSDGVNPFDTARYNIDSLIIVENGDTIDFRYTPLKNDSIIKFNLNTFTAPNVWANFNKKMTSQVIFHFDSINSDTLLINAWPKEIKEPCNSTWYELNQTYFNSLLIKEYAASPCYVCGDTLTLILNN